MTIRIERLLEDMQRQNRELEKRIESLETAEYNRHNKLLLLDGITPPGESSGWGTLYIDGSDGELKVVFGDSEIDQLSGLETVTGGDSHDHSGGDGAVIPESGLAAAVIAKLVTNGDSHDHVGGDGAAIAGIVTNGNSHDHSGGDGAAIPESGLASAVTAQLVTNGDSHNHDGGDGGTIGEGGVSFSGKLVTNGDSHNHSGGDGGSIPETAISNSVSWTNYSSSSSVTGWSSYSEKTIYYKRIGDLVFCMFRIYGTSNSTSTSFTLPYSASSANHVIPIAAMDAGSALTGSPYVVMNTSGGLAQCNTAVGAALTSWTNSGDKRIYGQFWFEV